MIWQRQGPAAALRKVNHWRSRPARPDQRPSWPRHVYAECAGNEEKQVRERGQGCPPPSHPLFRVLLKSTDAALMVRQALVDGIQGGHDAIQFGFHLGFQAIQTIQDGGAKLAESPFQF